MKNRVPLLPEPLQRRVFPAQNTIAIFINSPAMGSIPQNRCSCCTFTQSPLLVAESLAWKGMD